MSGLVRCLRQWLLGLAASACCATLALAHPMPESRVLIDSRSDGVTLTLQLPLNRLELAFGQPLADAPDQVLAQHADGLASYLLRHVGARTDNRGWVALRPQLRVLGPAGSAELEAVLELRAPTPADARRFDLLYDAVTHEVRTHRALVFVRNDWAAGQVAQALKLVGEVNATSPSLPVALGAPRAGASFMSLLSHGAHHIAAGADHMLFLLTLLLVAPLTSLAHRWAAPRPPGQAVRRLLGVVTAFTLGHSATLALGSSGWVSLPAALVETAVAMSIIVAAAHALRPLMRQGELWMAAGFGLLHGLAFAASLDSAGLTRAQHAGALLAFNLGIEAMQLLIVCAVMPPLLALARWAPAGYAAFKAVTAVAAAAAAAALIAEQWGWGGWAGWGASGAADALVAASAAVPALVGGMWLALGLALGLAAWRRWIRRRARD